MKYAMLILNPKSGKGLAQEFMAQLIFKLSTYDILVTPFITREACEAEYFCCYAKNYDFIIVMGGDGTMHEVANGLIKNKISRPIAYLPTGTTNDLAISLDIALHPLEALESFLHDRKKKVDIGKFNGNYFTYVAAAGAFTQVSYQTPQLMKNIFGKLAYFYEGIKNLSDVAHGYPLEIAIDGVQIAKEEYAFISISNTLSIGGILHLGQADVNLSDGKMELLLAHVPKNATELQRLISALRTKDFSGEQLKCVQGKHFVLSSEVPLPWTIDGEFAGDHRSVEITVINGALQFGLNEEEISHVKY